MRILKTLGLPERYRRLADPIRRYAGWSSSPGMSQPNDDYRELYLSYAKLAITVRLRRLRPDRLPTLQKLTQFITIPPRRWGETPVPFDPADIALQAVTDMIAGGYVVELHTPAGVPVYSLNINLPGLTCIMPVQMEEWAAEAVGAAARIDAHHAARRGGGTAQRSRDATPPGRGDTKAQMERARTFLGVSVAASDPKPGDRSS